MLKLLVELRKQIKVSYNKKHEGNLFIEINLD